MSEKNYTTDQVLDALQAFTQHCWSHEPEDIERLRAVSRPPMGNLPCCFYANFNLFWAGEHLQVCRQMVKEGATPVPMACQMLAGLLERHAARLEKWAMTETAALERLLVHYFKENGPATTEEFLAVAESALVALDRIQSWIDGILPWNALDAQLTLHRPIL